jgi:hypothetical protein
MENKFSRRSPVVEEKRFRIPVGVKVTPEKNIEKEYADETGFDPELRGRIKSNGPGKNVFIPNKYAAQEMGAESELSVLSDSSVDANQPDGTDPYDTGSFDTTNMWKSRSRK